MFVRSVIKIIHYTTYRNSTISLPTRMSQKSLLSFFQKKPVVSEKPLGGIESQCRDMSSDVKTLADAGMFPGGSESSNTKKPSGNVTPPDMPQLRNDVKLSDGKSENTKSSNASKTKKMTNSKKTPTRKKIRKAEDLLDTGEITNDLKSLDTGKLKNNKSVDGKTKHSKKTQVGKPVGKTSINEKTSVEEIMKNEKSPCMVDVESHNGDTSTDRGKSPEATQSPIVQKKRKRVAIIESDSEEESAEMLPAIKKARSSSDEADTKAREAVSKEVDSENAVEKVDTEESFEPIEKKQKNKVEVCDTPKPILRTLSYLGNKKKRSPKPKKLSEKAKTKSPKDEKTITKTQVKTDETKETADPVEVDSSTTPKRSKSKEKETNREKENNTSLLNRNNASDVIGSEYNPGKAKYDPIKDAYWKHGDKTPYLALAKTLQSIEETSARLKIIEVLSNYFRSVIVLNEKDLLPSIYLCLNKLGPAYEGQELGIAETYLMKAIAQCTGRTLAQIKTDAAESGDLGIVAEQSRSNQRIMFRPAHLTVQSVFNQLSEIAAVSGHSAVSKKIDKIQALFVACRDCEARFVIRSLAGKLRIGLAEQSVLQAVALACTTTPPNQERPHAILNASKSVSAAEFKNRVEEELLILKTTYCECPNYNLIVPVLLQDGVAALPERCKITPGIPVKPMLAQPTKGVQEVLQRFEGIKFTCEWKYDGERAQIHILEDGTMKIYSRNQEDNTSKYPDIIADLEKTFKLEVNSCILDAEAVAWNQEQKKILPFQILSTRKRKDANASEIKVRVCVFLFDLLYLNGNSLTQKTLAERRELLKMHFQEVEEKFKFVTSIDTHTMEEVQECLEESVKGNCEGLMVKTLDTEATYEIAKRSRNWLKLKKDYLEGCGDTLDLVVIGGYIGKGKRTGQYGGFLLASYDADNEEYQTICKIGTGFSEEALAAHSEFLKQHVILGAKPYYRYNTSHEPDHWFDAVQVWEVKCADLSLSPIYLSAVGLVDPEKGISLRFPRFLRIRDDKSVEQATSSQQVAELYQNQDQIKNAGPSTTSNFNEEDF